MYNEYINYENYEYNYDPMNTRLEKKEKINKDREKIELLTELIEKLNKYNEDGFYHMTHIENLESIITDEKIYSRHKMKEKNKKFVDLDKLNLVSHRSLLKIHPLYKQFVRFYLNKNNPVRYHVKSISCIIVLDYKVLYDQASRMRITNKLILDDDVEIRDLNKCEGIKKAINFDFDNMYVDYYTSQENYKKRYSEFLIENEISTKYIKKIIFSNQFEKNMIEKRFPNLDIECIVDKSYFFLRGKI